MIAEIIETNVAVVANNREKDVSPACVLSCVNALRRMVDSGMLVLDDSGEIFAEYRRHLSPSGQPGAGDEFMRWVFNHQFNSARCERVTITPQNGTYAEFPSDPDLSKFDPSDRKFVAVAIASQMKPPILNAVDSDYALFESAFKRHGVKITELCQGTVIKSKKHRKKRMD